MQNKFNYIITLKTKKRATGKKKESREKEGCKFGEGGGMRSDYFL